eukprot:5931684-Amphidinium_carterae.4
MSRMVVHYNTNIRFYDVRGMQPVVRLRKAWTEYPAEDGMQVDYEANPSVPHPPPKGSGPGKWAKRGDGDWIYEKDLFHVSVGQATAASSSTTFCRHPTCAKRRR